MGGNSSMALEPPLSRTLNHARKAAPKTDCLQAALTVNVNASMGLPSHWWAGELSLQ
jgi:hypothetical protein